jgi:hypothetical protein
MTNADSRGWRLWQGLPAAPVPSVLVKMPTEHGREHATASSGAPGRVRSSASSADPSPSQTLLRHAYPGRYAAPNAQRC